MNDFFSNESVYPNGVVATYREADLAEYCGNPLIEALPPIYSEIQARELLKYYPVVDPAVRAKPSHIRTHAVVNAADFFTPLPIHLALQQQLDRIIRSGYLNRNPNQHAHLVSSPTIDEITQRRLKLLEDDDE